MNNFATSKTFIGLMLFGVRAILTCATQFGVNISPDQEMAIMNLALFAIAIFSLATGHVDALNALPPSWAQPLLSSEGFIGGSTLKSSEPTEPDDEITPPSPQAGFVSRKIAAAILALGLAGFLIFGGCSPCINVPADTVAQVPAIAEQLNTVATSSAVPAEIAATAAGVKAALTSPTTPACQLPGWLSWAMKILEIVGPIILQEAPRLLTL